MAAAHLLHMVYSRTRATGVEEDNALTTHHFYSAASQWPDAAPANYETAETVISAFWTAMQPVYANNFKVAEYRWYREDDLNPPWGPPARVTAKNIPGTDSSGAMLPPQVAIAVTEYTGYEERENQRTIRHWGRFYLPAPSTGILADDGSIAATWVTFIANAVDTMYAGLTASGLVPSVRITGYGAEAPEQQGWVPVKSIRVDNLFDTIRRRRYESVTLREMRDTFGSPTDEES
jgi:hypothetical protein